MMKITKLNGRTGGTRPHDGKHQFPERVAEFGDRYQNLAKEMDAAHKREVSKVINCIVKLISIYKLSIEDIAGAISDQHPANRRKARYMDPMSGRTWSGRGRRPVWMKGRDPEEFLLPEDVD
ncbi:H-NS histone family protein [Burkholderia gladioli]|nr:H-NS histone family protein [Burkholderia gladioli]